MPRKKSRFVLAAKPALRCRHVRNELLLRDSQEETKFYSVRLCSPQLVTLVGQSIVSNDARELVRTGGAIGECVSRTRSAGERRRCLVAKYNRFMNKAVVENHDRDY